RVDVEVPVEHEAAPASSAGKPGDRLEATWIDLLKLGLEPLPPEELVQEAGNWSLVGRVTGDADQGLREVHDLIGDHRNKDPVLQGRAQSAEGAPWATAVSRGRGPAGALSSGSRRRSAGPPRSRSRPPRRCGRRAARPSPPRC